MRSWWSDPLTHHAPSLLSHPIRLSPHISMHSQELLPPSLSLPSSTPASIRDFPLRRRPLPRLPRWRPLPRSSPGLSPPGGRRFYPPATSLRPPRRATAPTVPCLDTSSPSSSPKIPSHSDANPAGPTNLWIWRLQGSCATLRRRRRRGWGGAAWGRRRMSTCATTTPTTSPSTTPSLVPSSSSAGTTRHHPSSLFFACTPPVRHSSEQGHSLFSSIAV